MFDENLAVELDKWQATRSGLLVMEKLATRESILRKRASADSLPTDESAVNKGAVSCNKEELKNWGGERRGLIQ
jgi:hypothetical protein